MDDASKWNEQDLLQLITNAVQESVQLDYKSCGALQNNDRKKNEISKDVSALANSAGGLLIYGIVEEGHIPIKLDEGFDPNVVTKEWLEQVINSRIHRKIDGLLINPIELSTSNPGRVAYVVIIPQSSRAPHQASDKRFYKRYNFESVPMEEYEVRDVSHRKDGPLLTITYQVEDVSTVQSGEGDQAKSVRRIKLMPLIQNESPIPAEYVSINLYIDKAVNHLTNIGEFQKQNDSTLLFKGLKKCCYRLHVNHAIPGKIPIFEGSPFRLLRAPLTVDIELDGDYFLGYSLLAPYMSEVFDGAILHLSKSDVVVQSI